MTMTHDPRQLRDNEIRRLAFDDGVPVTEIAKRFKVTESRVAQILDVTSNRQRIWRYLADHPNQSFTAREIALALHMDINRVSFYVDSLRKKGAVTADKRNGGKESGDHRMWFDVKLKRKPANGAAAKPRPAAVEAKVEEPVSLVSGEQAVITSTIEIPAEGQPVIVEQVVEKKAGGAPEGPWIKGNIGGWPALLDVRDRARVAKKRAQAAKLLEETGDDEIALTLLEKSSFTPLEEEVVHLLELFGEL